MRDLGMQSPRTVDMMDAEMPYDEDMDFGAQESFGDWLGRCGLRGPADANSAHGSVKISQKQRDELEHVWCNAAEADTLRRLVENLKDSELDIARREQLANGAWAHDFEEATAKAWSGKVEAASAAEMAAKNELNRKAREAEEAAAAAAAERCQAAAMAVESGELRGELREAMMAAEGQQRRAERLEADVRDAAIESQDLAKRLDDARRALTDAEQRASAAQAHAAQAEAAAHAERAAYEQSVARSMDSERAAAAARLAAASREAEVARTESSQLRQEMSARLESMSKDGEDGKAALRAAIAVREKEVEHSRRTAGEAQRVTREMEQTIAELEGKLGTLRRAAETRVTELERELNVTRSALDEAAKGKAAAEEGAVTLRRRAERALAEANAKAVEAQVRLRQAELHAQQQARESMAPPAQPRSAGDLEVLLANMTKAHAQALQRAEAAEGKSRSLHRELEHTKAAAEEAGKRVASAIDAVRMNGLEIASISHQGSNEEPGPAHSGGGGRRRSVLTLAPTMQRLHADLAKIAEEKENLEREVATLRAARAPLPASPIRGVVGGDEAEAKRAEVSALDAAIAERSKQLRKMEAAAATMKFAFADHTEAPTMSTSVSFGVHPATQQRRASDGWCAALPGRSLPTPRTRARTSLRLTHGHPNDDDASVGGEAPREPASSPGAELRRRAIAMGMRASPFAKRKRAP
jgi:chromosome segregation ATPase